MKDSLMRFVLFFSVVIISLSDGKVFAGIGENYSPTPLYVSRGIAPEGLNCCLYDSSNKYCWDGLNTVRYDYNDAVFLGVTDKRMVDLKYWDKPLGLLDGFYIYNSFKSGANLGNDSGVGYNFYGYNFYVTGIADYACFKMEKMVGSLSGGCAHLPKYLKWIGDYSFFGCKSCDIDFSSCHSNLERIGKGAFKNCTSLSFVLLSNHDKLTSIGQEAFMNCESLLQVNLPRNLKKVDEYCFHGDTSLQYVNFGGSEKLDSICKRAFGYCTSLENISLPESLKFIGMFAFHNCGLKGNLVIPDSVVEIQGNAFSSVVGLTQLIIGKSVKYIGGEAFRDCNLERVFVKGQEPPISFRENFNAEIYDTCTLFVPKGTRRKYLEADGWREFKKIEEYGEEYISPTGIMGSCEAYSIVKDSYHPLVLAAGTSHTLEASVEPENATDKKLFWKSGDESVAIIYDNKLEMLKEGTTTLTLFHAEGLSKTIPLICGQPVSEIKSPSEKLVYIGDREIFDFDVFPSSASSPIVNIYSEDPSIANISKNWLSKWEIEGFLPGSTIINLEATDGSGIVSKCVVNVRKKPIEKISLNNTEWSNPCSKEGSLYKDFQLRADIWPKNAENLIYWSSDNDNIASVDSNGLVTFKGYGDVKIRAASCENPDIFDECCIHVDYKVDCSIDDEVNKGIYIIDNTSEHKFRVNLMPDSLPIENLTWNNYVISPDGEYLATIEPDGNMAVLKKGEGNVTVRYMLYGSEYKIEIPVITQYYVTYLELDRDSLEIKTGESIILKASYSPKDALLSDKIYWNSSDANVAIVDQYGIVTGINPGNVVITARSSKEFDPAQASCAFRVVPNTVYVENIELNINNAVLTLQETLQLTATVLPEDATDKTVVWTSENSEVASVDANGKVTAISLGTAIITGSCGDVSASCTVHVVPTPAESITINREELTLKVGETELLNATVLPEDATDKTVVWTSENSEVVSVDANGKVTAISLGTAIITGSCGDVSASCTVHVVPTPAESVTINREELTLKVGETELLKATVLPEDATDKTVVWTSANEAVAQVDNDGNVMGVGIGSTEVVASCGSIHAICYVKVISTLVESVSLNQESVQLNVGDKIQLKTTVLPESASDKKIEWLSKDEAILIVDGEGNVSAIGAGETDVIATAADGSGVSAKCHITVSSVLVESLKLSRYIIDCFPGDSFKIESKIYPDNASNKTLSWSSTDESIVRVDENGSLLALKPGHAIVKAKAMDGSEVGAICSVTVHPILVKSIMLTPEIWDGEVGDTFKIEATVLPENASDKIVSWSSNDESVATVDSEGLVSVLAEGYCVITATASDGSGVFAECTVNGISGIDSVFTDEDVFDLYNINGILIRKDCDKEHLRLLTPDIYIIRHENKIKKLIINH